MAGDAGMRYDPERPLAGRTVLVTRARKQARELAEPLESYGAEVLAMPVLEIVDPPDLQPLDDAIRDLTSYDWVVLTSANAVERFFGRLVFVDRTAEALSHVKVAAVGERTAARMRANLVEPDLVPAEARAEGLVDAFAGIGVGEGCRILLPRALEAREVLPDALREMGAHIDVVTAYATAPATPDEGVLARVRAGTVDAVTLTSGAIARAFFSAMADAGLGAAEQAARRFAVASIGPVTTVELRDLGVEPDIEATEQSMASLADAIAEHFAALAG